MATPRSPRALRGLYGQTVETIGSRIVTGEYPPGSPLPSPDTIQRELGISKTVFREALRVLAAKGLVETRQKVGSVVQPRSEWALLDADMLRWHGGQPDGKFLHDLAEVREIVEPAGAALAARRRSESDLGKLRGALSAMAEAGADSAAMVEADLSFHRCLLYAAHNDLLTGMETVIEVGLRARDLVVHNRKGWPDPVPVHRAILSAVEEGDADAAYKAMVVLLEQASQDLARPRRRSR
jgi:GntR family galactonate operon transcriptional repressor